MARPASIPQLPFKIAQILSLRGHKALSRGALGECFSNVILHYNIIGVLGECWYNRCCGLAVVRQPGRRRQPTPCRHPASRLKWRDILYHTSYHIISYHIISYHIISYHIISYHIISYHIISYHIISYHSVSYQRVSCKYIYIYIRISCRSVSYHVISCHAIFYHIRSYHIQSSSGSAFGHTLFNAALC